MNLTLSSTQGRSAKPSTERRQPNKKQCECKKVLGGKKASVKIQFCYKLTLCPWERYLTLFEAVLPQEKTSIRALHSLNVPQIYDRGHKLVIHRSNQGHRHIFFGPNLVFKVFF